MENFVQFLGWKIFGNIVEKKFEMKKIFSVVKNFAKNWKNF